jgi:hypothetical protein
VKIMSQFNRFSVAWALMLALSNQTRGDIVTQWNFNSVPPDANTASGTLTPNVGLGTALLTGGTTGLFASGDASGGSTDPAVGDDSGWQTTTYAPQGQESGLRGVQFNVATIGMENIVITWDQRHSNTSSRFAQLQYSLDGSTFSSVGLLNSGIFEASSGGDIWYNGRSVDLSSISGVADNASFAFRIVAIFDPAIGNAYSASTTSSSYAASGTWRFDMVTINGTVIPAPGALALLALAGMTAASRRRA